jgi:hypothetical protein
MLAVVSSIVARRGMSEDREVTSVSGGPDGKSAEVLRSNGKLAAPSGVWANGSLMKMANGEAKALLRFLRKRTSLFRPLWIEVDVRVEINDLGHVSDVVSGSERHKQLEDDPLSARVFAFPPADIARTFAWCPGTAAPVMASRVMSAGIAAFVFGLLAGFVLLRLGRRKPLSAWERRVLPPLGWVLMATSITFAVSLLGWALLFGGDR